MKKFNRPIVYILALIIGYLLYEVVFGHWAAHTYPSYDSVENSVYKN